MSDHLPEGLDEVHVTMSKTVQEKEYEPLKITVSVRRTVPIDELSDNFRDITEILDNEIAEAFGFEDE